MTVAMKRKATTPETEHAAKRTRRVRTWRGSLENLPEMPVDILIEVSQNVPLMYSER